MLHPLNTTRDCMSHDCYRMSLGRRLVVAIIFYIFFRLYITLLNMFLGCRLLKLLSFRVSSLTARNT